MKKLIPFTKSIKFNTRIYEITSISLENTLSLADNNEITGEFIISGNYKINDSSINTESFIQGLPIDITLSEKYNLENIIIDIDDFKYEIVNEEILKVDINVLIDNIEEIKEEEETPIIDEIKPDLIIEAREEENTNERDENNMYADDLFKQIDDNVVSVNKEVNVEPVTSIFENFDAKDEKYVSYYVHIVRENDTLESISSQYKIGIDNLKEYNNIDQLNLGNKIIIPYINEDN